jgi:hypothetical protein
MTDEDRLLQFRAIYEAEIGNFPGNDGEQAGIWFRFIAPIPEDRHQELITAVSDAWGARPGKPRLREFRQMWKRMRFATSPDRPPETVCAACHNGWLVIPVHDVRRDGRHVRYEYGKTEKVLTEVAFPCRCTKGRDLQYQMGIPDSTCDAVWDVHRDIMKSAGHKTIEAPMSKAEFFRTQAGKRCVAPNGLKWRMVFDSRKELREALSAPVAAVKAPEPTPEPVAPELVAPEPWQDRERELVGAQDTSFAFGKSVGDVVEQAMAEQAMPGGYSDDELPF